MHEIPMTEPSEEPHIDDQIEDLVQKHWEAHSTPLLLSQLGSRISHEDAKTIKNKSENLATYLRERIANRVEVIQSNQIPALIGAIPANVMKNSNIDVDAMLLRTRQRSKFRRFHRAFWAAFVKEQTPQTRRYVSIGPPPQFQEISSDTTLSSNDDTEVSRKYEVTGEYIVGAGDDVTAVHSSIKRWLLANGLDESLFLADEESQYMPLPSDDLLGRMIVALTPEELKRMPIPLDIVSKLRRKSV